MNSIQEITHEDFNNSGIKISGIVIVECYDNNNELLVIMEPILKSIKEIHNENVTHVRVNIDKNKFLMKDYYVINVPTYLIFYNHKLCERVEGMIPFFEFENLIKNILRSENK